MTRREKFGYVTVRMWVPSHTILSALAEYEEKTITEYIDWMVRERAAELGFEIEESHMEGRVDMGKKKISFVTA